MIIINMKKRYVLPFFFPVFTLATGCICSTHREQLIIKNEELSNIKLELQHKEKIIHDLLNRISIKDQEIERLSQELHSTQAVVDDLKSNMKKLGEIDVQMEEKKEEVGHRIIETIPAETQGVAPGTDSVTTHDKSPE